MAPRSRHRRASSGPPVKQWKTVRSGVPSARRMSNVSSHASRVWMTAGGARSWASWICAANAVLLGVAGRVVVVVVEPGLADGDDARRVEEIDDRVDAVRRLVRVQSDGGVDVVESRRHLDRRKRRRPVAPDRRPSSCTPAARAAATAPSAPSGIRSSWMWQCESNQTGSARRRRHQTVRRGKRASPLVTATPPGY